MINILDYRRTSLEFRRLASNALTTNYTDGNLHLIRLRMYTEENAIINKIIERKIKGIDYDYKDNFFITEDGCWSNLNIPINDSEHIKAIYDYLVDITQKEEDIRGTARRFHCSSTSWNDIIRNYIEKVFKPLIDFIIDSLSMEMMILEPEKTGTQIYQSIGTNYGTANIAQRDISSVNNLGENNIKEIIDLILQAKNLIGESEIEEEVKEEVIDDLEIVQEQVESKEPKLIKLKKSCLGLKKFICSIPGGIGQATLIVTNLSDLVEKVNSFMGLIK
ncbi:hypothetical protein [Clostridium cochlearium]|uniref:hypothetical protein n=1 Tax=Clostridium cochlearium TaxID=1494 RepID=UPI000BBC7DA2|nr:hypothetical protein [Clostridium cochlearium]